MSEPDTYIAFAGGDQTFEMPRLQGIVLLDVAAERARQDRKWGVQNWPSLSPDHSHELAVVFEEAYKYLCETAFKRGKGSWDDIAAEEYAEVCAALDEPSRRKELIQLAAVIVAWIECIDRRAVR